MRTFYCLLLLVVMSGVGFTEELTANERGPFHTIATGLITAQNSNDLKSYLAEFKLKRASERQDQTDQFKRRREAWGKISRPKLRSATRSSRDNFTWVTMKYNVMAEKGKNVAWKVVFLKEGNLLYRVQMVDTTGRR